VLLKLAEFILRIKEYRYNIGRIKVGFKVILIELLLAKVNIRLKVGAVGYSNLLFRRLEVRKDKVYTSKDFI
jgi:hypothetical protein